MVSPWGRGHPWPWCSLPPIQRLPWPAASLRSPPGGLVHPARPLSRSRSPRRHAWAPGLPLPGASAFPCHLSFSAAGSASRASLSLCCPPSLPPPSSGLPAEPPSYLPSSLCPPLLPTARLLLAPSGHASLCS